MIKPHPTSKIQHPTLTFLLSLSLSLLFTGCPDIEEPLECGPHQIEVNGECECEPGYHWNDDHTACLLDTTSHAFDWQVYQFGDYSHLKDVAIINENDIWAVGQLYKGDSTYNAAHWDGSEWELRNIMFRLEYAGNTIYYTDRDPIKSVYMINNTIYFLSEASGFTSLENNEFYQFEIPWGTAPPSGHFWGNANDNIYFVGVNGSISHYNGTDFRRLSSPTEVDLVDVWGTPDGSSIWACGYYNNNSESVIIFNDGTGWQKYWERIMYTSTSDIGGNAKSVWTDSKDSIAILTSYGLWWQATDGSGFPRPTGLRMDTAPHKLDGNNKNDLFVFGERGRLYHYNGNNWHSYSEFVNDNRYFYSGEIFDNLVVAAGSEYTTEGRKALIVFGTRK